MITATAVAALPVRPAHATWVLWHIAYENSSCVAEPHMKIFDYFCSVKPLQPMCERGRRIYDTEGETRKRCLQMQMDMGRASGAKEKESPQVGNLILE